jgi:hypothetical protein
MGCFASAAAQDVTILHMKDGTTKRYTNGAKGATSIQFFDYAPAKTYAPDYTSKHENNYVGEWNVNQVCQIDGEYVVGLFWEDNVPSNFKAISGVLFGTAPGLTLDNCQEKMYATDARVQYRSSYGDLSYVINEHTNYMWIGSKINRSMCMNIDGRNFISSDTIANFIRTPLEIDHTYYYRTFSEGKALVGGEEQTVVFYGDERSFRVPRIMADFAYYPYPRATDEALAAFAAAHLPDSIAVPTWKQWEPLWNLWRATDEGKNYDLSADITTEEFDDGTGYRLNRIPDEFYTWIANREIVIDPFNVLEIPRVYDSTVKDSVYTMTLSYIENVDEKWGIPGGKYIRFEPLITTMNQSITYRSKEVVPGVRYKLQMNLAPETGEESEVYMLPTKLRVYSISGDKSDEIDLPGKEAKGGVTITTTESTTIEMDNFSTTAVGLDLRYQTAVSNAEIRRGQFNRILRIAEMRLTPVTDE